MYSSSRSAWTYVAGAKGVGNKPSFGTKGVPALSNSPGGRVASVMWHDFEGDVWLFGGVCSILTTDGALREKEGDARVCACVCVRARCARCGSRFSVW